jgi:hypothetical protein
LARFERLPNERQCDYPNQWRQYRWFPNPIWLCPHSRIKTCQHHRLPCPTWEYTWGESGYLTLSTMFFYNSIVESENINILFKLLSVTLFAILRRVSTVKNLFCPEQSKKAKERLW